MILTRHYKLEQAWGCWRDCRHTVVRTHLGQWWSDHGIYQQWKERVEKHEGFWPMFYYGLYRKAWALKVIRMMVRREWWLGRFIPSVVVRLGKDHYHALWTGALDKLDWTDCPLCWPWSV